MRRAVNVRQQLQKYLKRFKVKAGGTSTTKLDKELLQGEDVERVVKCFASAYFAHAAQLQADGTYKMMRGGARFWLHCLSGG